MAQNLVPNPGFETLSGCPPDGPGAPGPLTCPPWYGIASADHFHACANPIWRGVPINIFGYQQAHQGNAYGGCHWRNTNFNNHEYLVAPLLETLEAGVCYKIGYWANLCDECCPTNRLCALLTAGPPPANPIDLDPQLNWGGEFFSDTADWIFVFDSDAACE
jgi:hypothetical protein